MRLHYASALSINGDLGIRRAIHCIAALFQCAIPYSLVVILFLWQEREREMLLYMHCAFSVLCKLTFITSKLLIARGIIMLYTFVAVSVNLYFVGCIGRVLIGRIEVNVA